MVLPNTRYRAQRKYSAFARQQMIKSTFTSISTTTDTEMDGWSSDPAHPAVLAGNTLVVQGSGLATIHTLLYLGKNSVSGTPTVRLKVNGVQVDSVDVLPTSVAFGNTETSGTARPYRHMWQLNLAAGDVVSVTWSRSTSTAGYAHPGSLLWLEPGNSAYTMQRMYKSNAAMTLGATRAQVTGWTADAKYSGSTVTSNALATTLTGTGTVRAYVVITDTVATTADVFLMVNGVDVGSASWAAGESGGKWIEATGVAFTGANVVRLDAVCGASNRSIVANSPVVEALVPAA